ncbi:MAG: XdhC/CoxF family protein [Nitrospira sp.]|nr:XdhC/CoxF family protein [Nitrospira sp.]
MRHANNRKFEAHFLKVAQWPDVAIADSRTAVPCFSRSRLGASIAQTASETPAFYIGAQGSMKARQVRDIALRGLGVSEDKISAMRGPVGLIPGARDPRTLALSVIAEVAAAAQTLR